MLIPFKGKILLMNVLPLVKEPNPILHAKAVSVKKVTEEIRQLIDAMIETMYLSDGVGLAANQIGSDLNIFVASPDGRKGKEVVLLNAAILKRHGRAVSPEGCLSLPGISADVNRSFKVTVSGLDRAGKRVTLEAEGLLAKIFQHEVDHLEGHLFVDRVGPWRRKRLLNRYAALSDALRNIHI